MRGITKFVGESIGGVLVLSFFAWMVLGMPGTGYPGLLPGHNLVSKTTFGCGNEPDDPNDGVHFNSLTNEMVYDYTCTEEHYSNGTVIDRNQAGQEYSRHTP